MNCKPGDIAMVVFSDAGNEGKILRVLRLSDDQRPAISLSGHLLFDVWWDTDLETPDSRGEIGCVFGDSQLRPIRDSNGEDETLTWAGKPQCEPA